MHEAVQPGHPDVVDPGHAGAVDARGDGRLGRDRTVAGAGGDDADPPAGLRERPDPGAAGDLVDGGVGPVLRADGGHRLVRQPGRERHPVRVGRAQRGQQGHHLGRRLARSVDDLGIAGPARAVGVQPRESQIGEAWVAAGLRVAHAVDPSPADTLGAAARARPPRPHPQHPCQAP